MENIPDKSDSTAGSSGQLPASQYNDHKNENQKIVTRSGQTLNPAITDQSSKAIFINAIGAASMIDSGSGNTITLNPQTGGSGLVPPEDYAYFDGGVVCFNKATANTSTVVNIAPWGLTAKPLVNIDGSVPYIGDVYGLCYVKWDNALSKWLLISSVPAPLVDTYDDTEAVDYEVAGVLVDQYGDHYTSTGKAGNSGKDPVDPVNIAYWFPSDGAVLLEKLAKKGWTEKGGMHPINDRAGTEYAQNILIDKIKKGSITYNEYMVKLDGTVVTGNTTLENIFDIGGANEYPYIDIYAPLELGTRTLIDMGDYVSTPQSVSGDSDSIGVLNTDQANSIDVLENGTTTGASSVTVPDDGSFSSFLTMSAGGSTRNFRVSKKGITTHGKRFAEGSSYIIVMVAA